tara:strand:- start:1839 stop:3605 length:1767 start_codon:yes stop_codon:yes gene_type:complete
MDKNTTTLKDTYGAAYDNYKKGNLKTAETLCYKILSIDPNFIQSKILLANISAKNKDFVNTKKLLSEALDMDSKNISVLNNLGTVCKQLGETKNALNYYKKVIEIDPNNPNAYYNLGATCYDLGQLKEAKVSLQKATVIKPNFALPFFVLGNVHSDLKEYEKAISNYKKAIEINNNLTSAHNNLGLVFRALNDFDNAISSYEKALEIKNDHVGAHHNLALAFKELGKFDKAIKSHEMAIKYEPENLAHYFYLSNLKKDVLNIELKNKIEKIVKDNKASKINIAYGNYLLSKYEQKQKNYEKELNFLIEGHQLYFDARKAKFEILVKYNFEDIIQIKNGVELEKLGEKNTGNIKPIFIIGVPRCGSTLVEKIIGSGAKFVPMGEETSVIEEYVTAKILKNKSLNLGNIEDVRNELLNIYKHKGLISEKFNNTFTDKSLNNFFFLKIIKEIFPNAKIINCERDVLSSIMSIFQNQLSELAWAHDLDNIFKYFDNCFKIIENYNKTNPNFIYNLQYDKLVNNPEEESKKLMKFCELPWDKKCLEFYKRKDLVSKTASNLQIRNAIYKNPADRYLPYKHFLNKYGNKYSWFN